MSHIVRRLTWGTVSLNTETGHIFVQEEWRYTWLVGAGARAWTLAERRSFHHAADAHVWARWANRLHLRTAGASPFCRRFPDLPVEFDIRWVTRGGHWSVNVTKIARGVASPRSFVDFDARRIELDSLDVAPHPVGNDAHATRQRFYTVPHEFGHTMPDARGSATPVDDEYNAGSAHLGDTDSIMNIGREVRGRHAQAVIGELNAMLPDCTFSAR